MRVTDWYSASVKPVRKGWYEVALCSDMTLINMCYWTGERWQWSEASKSAAAIYGTWDDVWRGLVRKAK